MVPSTVNSIIACDRVIARQAESSLRLAASSATGHALL
jgi:hypothetical protein